MLLATLLRVARVPLAGLLLTGVGLLLLPWVAWIALTGLLLSGVGLLLLPWIGGLIARLVRVALSWLVCHEIAS